MTDKIKTIKRISLIVGLAVLLAAVLTNFLPILNIRLDGVESDYTFGAPGGTTSWAGRPSSTGGAPPFTSAASPPSTSTSGCSWVCSCRRWP